ncbi:MAG TPA: hypothetical protein VFH87_07440 [Candidatus Udaeobacter sp.]|nr:hypothetical protein [Candidatus Udaeobacter sp.]
MRIDVTREEFEAIVNRLKGMVLKSEQKLATQLAQRLDWQLHPSKAPDKNGWAPIRIKSNWPSGHINPDKKQHWSFHKPKKSKDKPEVKVKKKLTADEILAEL